MEKKPWQYRTIVVNAILGLLGAIALFVPAASGMATWMSAHAAEIAMGWSVLGMGLSLVTHNKVTLSE